VKKEFTNQDGGNKIKYQPSGVKIDDSDIPETRLKKWEALGWIERVVWWNSPK